MQNSIGRFAQAMSLGKFAMAQQILDDHKLDIQNYFPSVHPANCSVINNQAMLFKLNGRFIEAREMFQEVYDTYKQIYGEHHQSTVNTLINLATVTKDLQEHDKAVKLYEAAIEGRRVTEGENSVQYAMALSMCAGCHRELKNYYQADKLLKDAYLIIALEDGEENVPASAILNSMGILYRRQGKHERSKDAYERALAVREELLGAGHPETLSTRHNLAELLVDMAQPERSQELFQKNVELMGQQQKQ